VRFPVIMVRKMIRVFSSISHRLVSGLALLLFLSRLSSATTAPVDGYKVVAIYPHSTESYTEGFFYLDGKFYEGTGRNGQSAVMALDPKTGKPTVQHILPPQYFGEGIVDWGPHLLEWTWKSEICFVYDRATLQLVTQFNYKGEGWGITRTAAELITSDGSATLTFREPNTFLETHHIVVKDDGKSIDNLNELEFVKGEIYANVWHSDRIARIAPQDGHVIAWIDLTGLLPAAQKTEAEAVLNGIAYDAQHDRLFVTGKLWPTIFEIKIVPHYRQQPHLN
jgi:glutaminyl-peptide cyclotransferase